MLPPKMAWKYCLWSWFENTASEACFKILPTKLVWSQLYCSGSQIKYKKNLEWRRRLSGVFATNLYFTDFICLTLSTKLIGNFFSITVTYLLIFKSLNFKIIIRKTNIKTWGSIISNFLLLQSSNLFSFLHSRPRYVSLYLISVILQYIYLLWCQAPT